MILRIIKSLDQIPSTILITINLCLAIFVMTAHGGYLAAELLQNNGQIGQAWWILLFTLPLALLIFITGALSFFKVSLRDSILKIHASILAAGAIICFLWSIYILLKTFAEGGFSWFPGLLSFLCFYPIYLLRRSVFKNYSEKSSFIYYIHIWFFLIVFTVDMSIFIKLLLKM